VEIPATVLIKMTNPDLSSTDRHTDKQYDTKILGKIIKALNLYTYKENAYALAEIRKKTGLPKTTVFRILKSLQKASFLKYDSLEEKYSLGLRFFELCRTTGIPD
jgi:IclR family transcriptional regulator, KDG regulon repressor